MIDEDELQRRLKVLRDEFEAGRVKFAPKVYEQMKNSILAVRYAPDGSVDLNTVDSRVRALAMGVTATKDRENMKEAIPIKTVQETYFKFVEDNFGFLFRQMQRQKLNPGEASYALSKDIEASKEINASIPDFVEALKEFWDNVSQSTIANLQDSQNLKAVFGGDLFPSHSQNIAALCGLYVDTIVLTDPFMQSRRLFDNWAEPERVRYFVKHALNVLQYKELALADVEPRIVTILPYRSSLEEQEAEFLVHISRQDSLKHAGAIFGTTFSEEEELIEFVQDLDTPEKVVSAIVNKEKLLFDTEWNEPLEKQIQHYTDAYADIVSTRHPGEVVAYHSIGRMRQANDILLRSQELGGIPLIDSLTSWKHFGWKLEYDAGFGSNDDPTPLHTLRGLQNAAAGEMEWLGNVPPDALVEIRKHGAIDEIREMLSRGVNEIAIANPSNFFRTSDEVLINVQEAFEQHKKNLKDISGKKWSFAGKDIGSWIVTGTIELAAAIVGDPALAVSGLVANQLLDAPKLKDIPNKFRVLQDEDAKLKRSPLGILFRSAK